MATARYTRIDNNRGSASSGYCSKVTVVMFVSLCLVGVWMLTSSSVVPVDNTDLSQENKNDAREQVTETKGGNSQQFEDNPGDLPLDATKEGVTSGSLQNESRSDPQETREEKDPKPEEKSMDANDSGTEKDEKISGDGDKKVDRSADNSGDSEEASVDKKSFSDTSDSKSKLDEGEQSLKAGDIDSKSDYGKKKSDLDDNEKKYDLDDSKKKSDVDDSQKKYGLDDSKKKSEIDDSETKYGSDDSKKKSDLDDSEKKYDSDDSKKKSGLDDSEKKYDSSYGNKKSGLDDSEKRYDSDDSKKKSGLDDSEKRYGSDDSEKKSDVDDSKKKSDSDDTNKKSEDSSGETKTLDKEDDKKDEKVDQADGSEVKSEKINGKGQGKNDSINEVYPSGSLSEFLNVTTAQNGSFSTQATESKKEKEAHESTQKQANFSWKLCNVTAGPDYIPCLDNLDAIKHLRTTKHYEHRERHCPVKPPTCLVPLPEGYKRSVQWPKCREKIWYSNVPHTKLAEVKGHQNWVKIAGEYLTFPGGGTQFKHGALHYVDFIQEAVPDIAWGNRSRVVLDVGCGVASFGGYLFDRDVLTMSLAPKDEHEAQVQFALERGIPAISAVMGTTRLPFPSRVFDIVHCARCRVPWHIEGGKLLLELNRVLRPGGFFVWSATPVYQKIPEDAEIWEAMKKLTKDICWETVSIVKDKVNRVGIAIYRKTTSNECYKKRSQKDPPLCSDSDDPNAAWNVTLKACMHKVPVDENDRGSKWPEQWPARVSNTPYWLLSSQTGVYGKHAPDDFVADSEHWKKLVSKTYLNAMGINWSSVRNVMDMRAVYGGFAAALKDLKIWVMNVVSIDSADTLPIIYERGLFGIYHDWCESFSTYPRSYDLLHADHLFSRIKKRCSLVALIAEVDRILRPEGILIVQDDVETLNELESMVKAMQWKILMSFSKEKEGILSIQKSMWRPKESETLVYAIT